MFATPSPLSFSTDTEAPTHRFSVDWYNQEPSTPLWFRLTKECDSYLVSFGSALAPCEGKSEEISRGFFEGLWEYDVFELFIFEAPPQGSHLDIATCPYQEWNFSPYGSWWTAQFESYRKRSLSQPPEVHVACNESAIEVVSTCDAFDKGPWEASFRLPASVFTTSPESPLCRIQASAISHDEKGSPSFFVWHKPANEKDPDFHDLSGIPR